MTTELTSTDRNHLKPAIYPTLVIGLGGAGTNVVRVAKQRFLNSWRSHGKAKAWDDMPDVFQVLAVDTEPLINRMGETPLYFNEFAFLGKFDATKLVANRAHHPYLSWWGEERDIQLGYVHNGAKQLRPIGRLAFFRNYITFKKLMTDKVKNMLDLGAIQQAEQRGFEVMRDHRLIFIVSSLCGGTGAGMFLDAAHRVRHEVGSNASVIGIFLLPSVFEGTISSDIQRRRIRANAYAALKELEHFHETQSFKALYPSEQTQLPETPYRAFSRIFLMESTNSEKVTLSDKTEIEQMVAHFIHLLAFSPLNKDILGQDVNAHSSEERTASGRHRNYSAFASAAIVMPRSVMDHYLVSATIHLAGERLNSGMVSDKHGELAWQRYLALRDELKNVFRTYAVSEKELTGLDEDVARTDGRWLKFSETITKAMRQVLRDHGLTGCWRVADRLSRKEGDSAINREDLGDPSQFPLTKLSKPTAPAQRSWGQRLVPNAADTQAHRDADTRYKAELATHQLVTLAEGIWRKVLEKIRGVAEGYKSEIPINHEIIITAQKQAEEQGKMAEQQMDPLRPNGDREANTIYEMETGVMRDEYAGDLFDHFARLLQRPIQGDSGPTGWQQLHDSLCNMLLPQGARQFTRLGAGDLDRVVRGALAQPPLNALFTFIRSEFDIRNIFYIQYAQERQRSHGSVPPYFAPKQVMGSHVRPFAFADADLRPFSYADVDPITVVSVPGDGKDARGDVDRVFDQVMRDYGEFKQVHTGSGDRMDACYIVHGLPLELISSLPDLHRQYHGGEFPKSLLHLETNWMNLSEIYTPIDQEPQVKQTSGSQAGGNSTAEAPPKSAGTKQPRQAGDPSSKKSSISGSVGQDENEGAV